MSRIDRTFSYTMLPPNVDPGVREAFQAMAKAIDQLTSQINHLSFGQSLSDLKNGGPAGNFNGKILTGRITTSGVAQKFFHNLGRVPICALELLTIPQPDEPGGAASNVVAGLCVTAMDAETITLLSLGTNNKPFTLVVM